MLRKEIIVTVISIMADLLEILEGIYWLHEETTKAPPCTNETLIVIGIIGAILALFYLANMLYEHLKRRRRDHSKRLVPNESTESIADEKEEGPQPTNTISIHLVEGTHEAVEPLCVISIRVIFDGVKY